MKTKEEIIQDLVTAYRQLNRLAYASWILLAIAIGSFTYLLMNPTIYIGVLLVATAALLIKSYRDYITQDVVVDDITEELVDLIEANLNKITNEINQLNTKETDEKIS